LIVDSSLSEGGAVGEDTILMQTRRTIADNASRVIANWQAGSAQFPVDEVSERRWTSLSRSELSGLQSGVVPHLQGGDNCGICLYIKEMLPNASCFEARALR
jgi:hypothetical protein